ncbi:MAG TPA: TIGR02996 domain-containing protein [Gemmataceae bacterium]|nr:TIGR02996 domain-containing protein [Gemmataceae bacterium]
MTPEAALLQAVVENPADDAVRLVYADWLEEHGDVDRAEFIRVQVQRASLPSDAPQQAELRTRSLALTLRCGSRWRGQLPMLPGISWHRFWRGFLSGATVTRWKHYRLQATALFAATPIQFLRLLSLNTQQCVEFVESARLRQLFGLELRLRDWERGDEAIATLAGCPRLVNLQSLQVSGPQENSTRERPFLWITTVGASALAASPYLNRLASLDLRDIAVENEGEKLLRARFGEGVHL